MEQALADIGFETFCEAETEQGPVSLAYIQTDIFNRSLLEQTLQSYPDTRLLAVQDCPDEDWNSTWEEEHPEFTIALPHGSVLIRPHCAFGAGYHETTNMLIEQLIQRSTLHTPLSSVLDNGCGTGVLGIVAAKLGAAHVTMVDIDEHSVRCAQENCLLNGLTVDTILLGDTPPEGRYDLILSNIHKNILLAQMPLYARYLTPDGQVWISGFYASDAPDLLAAAAAVGLTKSTSHTQGDWCLLQLQREG